MPCHAIDSKRKFKNILFRVQVFAIFACITIGARTYETPCHQLQPLIQKNTVGETDFRLTEPQTRSSANVRSS